jgi:Fe-S-cluster containining protein
MQSILTEYLELLEEVDRWFAGCVAKLGAPLIQCRAGCSACCRGLFDITLLDARLLYEGVSRLPASAQRDVRTRAQRQLLELQQRWPDFTPPYDLNRYPDEEWTVMPEDDMTPCPLLGGDGRCLVYQWRPLTCRLHGLPNIDLSGESFSDAWCTLNFVGSDPLPMQELRWEFRERFTEEIELFRRFSAKVIGEPVNELDTFIPPALLIDFDQFDWIGWWRRLHQP